MWAIMTSKKPSCPIHNALATRLLERLDDTTHTFTNTAITWPEHLEVDETFSQAGPLFTDQQELDVLIAPLNLAYEKEPAQALLAWGKALKKDGLLLASAWGDGSLKELAELLPERQMPTFPDIQDVGGVIQKLGYALPVIDRDVITLTFSSIEKMNETLKLWDLLPEDLPETLEERYKEAFPHPQGYLPLTMEVLYIHGWKPDANQPKALKPGQYTVSLEDALKS